MNWIELFFLVWAPPIIPMSRYMYGRMRAYAINNNNWDDDGCDEGGFGVGAMALGLIWPLAIFYVISVAHPHKYQPERRREADAVEMARHRALDKR